MLKNISIHISAYLDSKEELETLLNLLPENLGIKVTNDNPKYIVGNIDNNDENIGKFQTIINSIKSEDKKYIIILDPDDILLNNIEWSKLEEIDNSLDNKEIKDLIINSYYLRKKMDKEFKLIKKPRHIFNPCTIYNTKNINENIKLKDKKYINYMDDLALASLSINDWSNVSYLGKPFYKYTYSIGISFADKGKYKTDLKNSLEIIKEREPFLKIKDYKSLCFYTTRIYRLKKLCKKYNV